MSRAIRTAAIGYTCLITVWLAVHAHGTTLDAFGVVAALWILMPYDTRQS